MSLTDSSVLCFKKLSRSSLVLMILRDSVMDVLVNKETMSCEFSIWSSWITMSLMSLISSLELLAWKTVFLTKGASKSARDRDEGAFNLPAVWTNFITAKTPGGSFWHGRQSSLPKVLVSHLETEMRGPSTFQQCGQTLLLPKHLVANSRSSFEVGCRVQLKLSTRSVNIWFCTEELYSYGTFKPKEVVQ